MISEVLIKVLFTQSFLMGMRADSQTTAAEGRGGGGEENNTGTRFTFSEGEQRNP